MTPQDNIEHYAEHKENLRLHGEIHRLQTVNAQLLEALTYYANIGHLLYDGGKRARAAIAAAEEE